MALKTLTAEEVLNDDSTSNWLKQALRVSLKRDLIDTINDVEVLQIVLNNILRDKRITDCCCHNKPMIDCTCGGHEELRDGIKVYHETCDL